LLKAGTNMQRGSACEDLHSQAASACTATCQHCRGH